MLSRPYASARARRCLRCRGRRRRYAGGRAAGDGDAMPDVEHADGLLAVGGAVREGGGGRERDEHGVAGGGGHLEFDDGFGWCEAHAGLVDGEADGGGGGGGDIGDEVSDEGLADCRVDGADVASFGVDGVPGGRDGEGYAASDVSAIQFFMRSLRSCSWLQPGRPWWACCLRGCGCSRYQRRRRMLQRAP